MAGGKIRLADDFRDLLRAFVAHDVRFLVVGAYALAVLGRPRATGDLDFAGARSPTFRSLRTCRATHTQREPPRWPGRSSQCASPSSRPTRGRRPR